MDLSETYRLFNAALVSAAFILFSVRLNDDWRSLTRGWKVLRLGVLGLLFAGAFGVIETMLAEPPVALGARSFVITVVVIVVLIGLWMVRKEDPPAEPGWIRASDVNAILAEVEDTHKNAPCHNPGCIAARHELRKMIRDAELPERLHGG